MNLFYVCKKNYKEIFKEHRNAANQFYNDLHNP